MIKAALICAFPAGSNTGMLSVDLSFDSLMSKIDREISVTRFCSWRSFEKTNRIYLKYDEYTSTDQLKEFDLIIFWGDFLHWITYAENDWYNRAKNKNADRCHEDIIDQWYDLYLLENDQDLQKKTIIAGGTLYGLKSEDLANERYMAALSRLYNNARLVMVRDFFSRYFLEQIVSRPITVGGDCALLLDSRKIIDAYPELSLTRRNDAYALYAFGRSGSVDILKQYASDIANHLQIEILELEWLKKGTGIRDLAQRLDLIKHCQFIITDIYHCAVNSYREKKSVICIGNGASRIKDTLSEKKKEVLHFQLFSQERYRYLENILESFDDEVLRAARILKNDRGLRVISDIIDRQIIDTTEHLREAMFDK